MVKTLISKVGVAGSIPAQATKTYVEHGPEKKKKKKTCSCDTTLMAEDEEELKSLLIRVKEESEKAGLKLNIKKTKIVASGPITRRQMNGEK